MVQLKVETSEYENCYVDFIGHKHKKKTSNMLVYCTANRDISVLLFIAFSWYTNALKIRQISDNNMGSIYMTA